MRSSLAASCLVALLWTVPVQAAPVYVIPVGHEREVQALFAPHKLGQQVAGGWRMENLTVRETEILVELIGPEERHFVFTVMHPSVAGITTTRAGAVALDVPTLRPGSVEAAIDALTEALVLNAATARALWIATASRTDAVSTPWYARLPGWAGVGAFALLLLGAWWFRRRFRPVTGP
jgi:hypothetical protein